MINPTLTERERSLIRSHLQSELKWALQLVEEERWDRAGDALRQVAYRCDSLAEDTP